MRLNQSTILGLLAIVALITLTQSCTSNSCEGTRTYTAYTPIYKSLEDIRQEIGVEEAREICNPGKMFLYGNYIYVNDIAKGIHIINNSDPTSPFPIAFINIPGNVDIAVKEKMLYADNFTDLEYFDISDPTNPIHKGRVENVFESATLNTTLGQLVGYDEQEVTETYDCDYNYYYDDHYVIDFFDSNIPVSGELNTSSGNWSSSAPSAIAGSLSRFASYGNYLYIIDGKERLDVFDITDRNNPVYNNEVEVAWGIETLFPLGENLFIGAEDGLFIYGLDTDPTTPSYKSVFQHARACDPVFVQETTAYVTLRSGTECQGFNNQLDVVDVTNLTDPQLITSVSLDNPHGLSLKEDLLIICEGEFGFKIFDKSDVENISGNQLSHEDNFTAFDVIILPGTTTALIVGQEGLYQYDFSIATDPKLISIIPATRNCNI